MSETLKQDLERIAKLRGKDPAAYTPESNRQAGYVRPDVGLLINHCGVPRRDLEAFDRLPPGSRRFLAEYPYHLNSLMYESFLRAWHWDEDALLKTLKADTQQVVQGRAGITYRKWPTHPQARRCA